MSVGEVPVGSEAEISCTSSPWTQTDWSGGTTSGTVTGTVTTYESETDIDTSVAGEFKLDATAEEFSNTALDSASDINSWLGKTPSNVSGLQFLMVAGTGAYTGDEII